MDDDCGIRSTISRLSALAGAIASGHYRKMDADDLFAMTTEDHPPELRELAEAFGMMMVKIEAREFHLQELVAELEQANRKLREYSEELEDRVAKRTGELEEANRKLDRLAHLDGLTGIANRRYLDAYLQRIWLDSGAEKRPLSFIMADIDHFKRYNDTYGHQDGDECLKKVARVIQENTRRSDDLAARYGGEEFSVVLIGTGPDEAFNIAERIRRDIEALRIPHKSNPLGPYVTLSLGTATVAAVPAGGKWTPGDLIEAADEALYTAKKERGRNCSVAGRILD
ncbi:MAG TPA: diguanylate cyclase [Syntrophales bacterium]|nr:diguanylate cyclase [Syntrophales bacterium]